MKLDVGIKRLLWKLERHGCAKGILLAQSENSLFRESLDGRIEIKAVEYDGIESTDRKTGAKTGQIVGEVSILLPYRDLMRPLVSLRPRPQRRRVGINKRSKALRVSRIIEQKIDIAGSQIPEVHKLGEVLGISVIETWVFATRVMED